MRFSGYLHWKEGNIETSFAEYYTKIVTGVANEM